MEVFNGNPLADFVFTTASAIIGTLSGVIVVQWMRRNKDLDVLHRLTTVLEVLNSKIK